MSQENVEIVRRGFDAWNRRDLTTWLALFRGDAEIDWTRSRGPLKGIYRGQVEWENFWREFFSTFEDVHIEIDDLKAVGSDVVAPNVTRARGREGIEVIARSAFVFTVKDAQIISIRLYQDRAAAFGAAGESE